MNEASWRVSGATDGAHTPLARIIGVIAAGHRTSRRVMEKGGGPGAPSTGPAPSGGDAGEVEADDAGQDQADRQQLRGGYRVTEEGHADHRGARGADAGPYRVGGPDLEMAQRHGQQGEAQEGTDREDGRRPDPGHPVTHLQRHRETRLEQAGGDERQPCHRVASLVMAPFLRSRRGNLVYRGWSRDGGSSG